LCVKRDARLVTPGSRGRVLRGIQAAL
jgi:hypothetical protein